MQKLCDEAAGDGVLEPANYNSPGQVVISGHTEPLKKARKLDDGNTSFLFESVEGGEKWGRYSFMGSGARAIFRARGRDVEWTAKGETRRVRVQGDPLEYLRDELARLEPVHLEGVELPRFLGGAVGMVSYDWVRFVERIPDANPDEIEMPDLWFVLPETIVVHDRLRKHAFVVRHVEIGEGADVASLYREAAEEVESTVRRLRNPLPAPEINKGGEAQKASFLTGQRSHDVQYLFH